ncbi:MAG: hypothetical protein AAF242_08035, partial [Bacteroidota bacterium]
MSIKLFLPISCVLGCILLCAPLQGRTFYLDQSGGSNSNNGLSPASAWQTIQVIAVPGDTFLFKYGEVWEANRLFLSKLGWGTDPIYYGAYGNPADERPILAGIYSAKNARLTTSWSLHATNIWKTTNDTLQGRIFLNGVEQLRASSQDSVGIADNEGAVGQWFYNDGTKDFFLSATANPATLYNDFEGSRFFVS